MTPVSRLLPWFLSAGVAWSLGYFYNAHYGGELSWLKRLYEQKATLLGAINQPRRLILVGGSGVHYTVNSEYMSQRLGMEVFNFGLQGDIGLNVFCPMILDKVRQNDTVVLIPEYLMLLDEDGFGKGEGLYGSGPFGLVIGKPGLGGIPPKRLLEDFWLLGVPGLRALTKSGVDLAQKGKVTGYYADPITKEGDPTFVKPRTGKWWKMKIEQPISDHSLQRIAQFQQELRAKGANLVVSLAWIYADTEDPKTRENVRLSAQKLEQIVPTVYNRETLNLKDDAGLFADTHYHLLPPARLLRSQELVEQLKPILENFSQAPTQAALKKPHD